MQANTYINPVYPGSFPDPFVLKYGGEYYGYCTRHPAGRTLLWDLHSPDLVHWDVLAGAMEPLPGGHTMYWAPEVLYYNGLFYMYYSVGNETFMEIRVAVAAQPSGPFEDSGRTLTIQQFAIDAHVFKDDDGSLHLFYATDFLEHSRIGTGTVVDRLLDPFTPEGLPDPLHVPATTGKFTTPAGQKKAACAGIPSKGRLSSNITENITRCSVAVTGKISVTA